LKRITKYVALILIFALSGLTAFSFICYAETEVKGKEYYVELAENDPYELAENDPYIVLKRVNNYKDQPWAQEVIEAAAEKNPTAALQFANRYKEKPYAQKIIETAAEKRPQAALLFADYYMDQPYAQKIIETAAEKEPFAVLVCADRYVDQHWALKVVEEAIESIAENDPRRIPLMMLLPSLLQESKKPLIKTVLAIYEHFRYVKSLPNHGYLPFKAVRMFGMLEEMVSKNMTVEEAVNIVCDDKKFFRTLLKIKSKPNHLGRVAVDEELKKVALRRVRMIDDSRALYLDGLW